MTSENNKHTKNTDRRTTSTGSGNNMGYLVFSGRELQRWNLKFLVYHDGEKVSFCETDFYVKKVLKHDQMFIYCIILDSSWSKKDLKRQIRKRAPHADMNDEAFFWANKSYKRELDMIRRKSYHVGQPPEDFLDPDMKQEVAKLEAKVDWEKKWLKRWRFRVNFKTLQFRASNKTIQKHEKRLEDLQNQIRRIDRLCNRPDESDPWSDCETTYEDFELYHF